MDVQNVFKKYCCISGIFIVLYLLDSATINKAGQECFKTIRSSIQWSAAILDIWIIKKRKPSKLLLDQLN